jgi:hypothetical protein
MNGAVAIVLLTTMSTLEHIAGVDLLQLGMSARARSRGAGSHVTHESSSTTRHDASQSAPTHNDDTEHIAPTDAPLLWSSPVSNYEQ